MALVCLSQGTRISCGVTPQQVVSSRPGKTFSNRHCAVMKVMRVASARVLDVQKNPEIQTNALKSAPGNRETRLPDRDLSARSI